MADDKTGLAWSGAPKPVRTGGFVGSVSMNTELGPKLAVDPEGVARGRTPKREQPGGGASVEMTVMEPNLGEVRERKGGRFKMPLG